MDTPADPGAGSTGRRAHDTIRARLAWLPAFPLVGVLILLGNLVHAEFGERGHADQASRTTRLGQVAQGLVHELQRERGLTSAYLGGFSNFRGDLETARAGVDRERTALAGLAGPETATARSALEQLVDLASMRVQVDAGRLDRSTAFRYFSDRIAALNHVDLGLDEPSPSPDPVLRRGFAVFQALSTLKEALAAERGSLIGSLSAGRFTRDEYAQFIAARNAESLLVLVGEATPRRWSTPLPMADVLRAAVAEVEEYRRVSLRRIDDAFGGGGCVPDIAHLLAELVENGLTFSPPDADVEVHGRRLGPDYLIAVVDHGIGMEPQELARANARLRGEERFTVAPTRFLGHYVVGDLATALGGGAPQRALAPAAADLVMLDPVALAQRAFDDDPPRPGGEHSDQTGGRTRNGLPRRMPRPRGGTTRPPAPDRHAPPAGQERRPADVRGMLTSLRDGVRRGQASDVPEPARPAGGDTDLLQRGDT